MTAETNRLLMQRFTELINTASEELATGLFLRTQYSTFRDAPSIRPKTPLSLEDARRLVQGYVEHYNDVRLNSAIGYITLKDMLAGRQQEIHAERNRKLEAARKQR